jgi:hypothetical protein
MLIRQTENAEKGDNERMSVLMSQLCNHINLNYGITIAH